ncbi:MAG: hypothetical protein HRT64_15140 [Erythrobacter sp.]|nr:hypothetical protein [Erythrobacter sp.]
MRDTIGFLRWRLIPVRKLGKLKNQLAARPAPGLSEASAMMDAGRLSEMNNRGWTSAPSPSAETLRAITEIYMPRADDVVPTDHGHPFENVVRPEDFDAQNPLFRFAFSDAILGAANAYFGGAFSMASLQVMRSFPTQGDLRESQRWHRDFGDAKSLHFVMYLSEVTTPEHGPFAFIDKQTSKRVRRSPVIRRLTDAQIASEVGSSEYETFYGRPGDAIFVDPAVCYHFGSRCRVPRTAVFITFNTHAPYTEMMQPLGSHRAKAAAEAKIVRPDLPPEYIDRILQV